MKERLDQSKQMLAKVDTPLDMAEGISYHLQQLMNEKDDASDNLENGRKEGAITRTKKITCV